MSAPIVQAHIGNTLTHKAPSVWVFAYAGVHDPETGKEKIHFIGRDVAPSQSDRRHFLNVPGRAVFKHELTERNGQTFVNLGAAVDGILDFYIGRTRADFPEASPPEVLLHEPTCLFSGPDLTQNQQVIVVDLCLGRNLKELPRIIPIEEGGHYPPALSGNNKAIEHCRDYRHSLAYVDFERTMAEVTQDKNRDIPLDIYYPFNTPFIVRGLSLQDGAHFDPTVDVSGFNSKTDGSTKGLPLQGTMLHVMELMAEKLGIPHAKRMTEEVIDRVVYELDNGKYRDDPRAIRHEQRQKSPQAPTLSK